MHRRIARFHWFPIIMILFTSLPSHQLAAQAPGELAAVDAPDGPGGDIELLSIPSETADVNPVTPGEEEGGIEDSATRPAGTIGELRATTATWRVVEEGDYQTPAPARGGRFDPARHTPNFVNSITVHWTVPGRDRMLNGELEQLPRSYNEGCCSGMCAMAHIYYRELTQVQDVRAAIRDDFQRAFFNRRPIPAVGSPLRNLRDYCRSERILQSWAGSFSGSAQGGATPWSSRGPDYVSSRASARTWVTAITSDIRSYGTSRVSITWLKPSDGSSTGSHAILAYGIRNGVAQSGTGERARRANVKVIYLWDPNHAHPTNPGAGGPAAIDPKTESLIYFPETNRITFCTEYHARKNPGTENPETYGVMQQGEFAVVDTECWRTHMTSANVSATLRDAARADFRVTLSGAVDFDEAGR